MPVRSYHTVNGQIVGETQGGNLPLRTTYFHDALGSVIATTNQYGIAKNAIRYSDWGAINFQNSGWGAMRYGWVGGWGYRSLGPVHSDTYVRRRVVSTTEGRWTTRDLLWPGQQAYGYGSASPASLTDPDGLACEKPDDSSKDWPNWFYPNYPTGKKTIDCLNKYANGKKNPKCQKALGGIPLLRVMTCLVACENGDAPSNSNPWKPDYGHNASNSGIGPCRVNVGAHPEFGGFGDLGSDECANCRAGIQILCECLQANGGNIGGCGTGARPNGGYDVISAPPGNTGAKNCFYKCMDRHGRH